MSKTAGRTAAAALAAGEDPQIKCGMAHVGELIAVDRQHHSRRKAAQGRPA